MILEYCALDAVLRIYVLVDERKYGIQIYPNISDDVTYRIDPDRDFVMMSDNRLSTLHRLMIAVQPPPRLFPRR